MNQTENKNQCDTKERILDAAERLFAENGFHTTSLRAITGAAEVNLAAVNYHFGSKEALVEAVLERRLTPLNQARHARLDEVVARAESQGRPPRTEEVLRAFVEPTLRFAGTCPGALCFVTIVGRVMAEPDEAVRNLFIGRMMPLVLRILDLLQEALPGISRQTLFWRLHFTLGAVSHILHMNGRLKDLPAIPGVSPEADMESMLSQIIPFLTAGMEAA